MAQANIRSLNKTLRALNIEGDGRYAATIELARTLARQMDESLPEPSTRLSAAYLSVLKDLLKAAPSASNDGVDVVERRRESERQLEEFMKRFG